MAKIISVHSFRGGTGKSNITANLAATVARRGHRVGVVDTDIQSPGIHIIFGLKDDDLRHSLNDYLWGRCEIQEAARDVTSVLEEGGTAPADATLFLIPSSLRTGEIAKVLRDGYDVSLLNSGFKSAIQRLDLDYLFIDTHPGLNEETLLSIALSNVLLIILRPDLQDYQGTAVTVEVARRLDVPQSLLVVNKVLPSYDFSTVRLQCESSYGVAVAGILPLSEDLIRLASTDLFTLRCPNDPWSRVVDSVAEQVMA